MRNTRKWQSKSTGILDKDIAALLEALCDPKHLTQPIVKKQKKSVDSLNEMKSNTQVSPEIAPATDLEILTAELSTGSPTAGGKTPESPNVSESPPQVKKTKTRKC